jgi:hypothetical protein
MLLVVVEELVVVVLVEQVVVDLEIIQELLGLLLLEVELRDW